MAKLNDLVRAVSEATGEQEAHLKVVARCRREAGLIATFGRGRHGAEMGPRDGAFMLLGLLGEGDAIRTDRAVEEVLRATFQRAELRMAGGKPESASLEVGQQLRGRSSALDVVALLLSRLARDQSEGRPRPGATLPHLLQPASLEFVVRRSIFGVELQIIASAEDRSTLTLTYQVIFDHIVRSPQGAREVEIMVRLGPQCAEAIAACLWPTRAADGE